MKVIRITLFYCIIRYYTLVLFDPNNHTISSALPNFFHRFIDFVKTHFRLFRLALKLFVTIENVDGFFQTMFYQNQISTADKHFILLLYLRFYHTRVRSANPISSLNPFLSLTINCIYFTCLHSFLDNLHLSFLQLLLLFYASSSAYSHYFLSPCV